MLEKPHTNLIRCEFESQNEGTNSYKTTKVFCIERNVQETVN